MGVKSIIRGEDMYKFILNIIRFILFIVNGRIEVQNKHLIEEEGNYVLVAPHRSVIDPIPIAVAGFPDEYSFMVKEELMENKFFNWLFNKLNFVPVDRENPGPSVLRDPVRLLKEGKKSFMLFPTGSRYSDDIKSGAVIIARLSRKNIIPVVYDGPMTIKGIFRREKMIVRFGSPIEVNPKKDKELEKKYNEDIREAFDRLQNEIDPSK